MLKGYIEIEKEFLQDPLYKSLPFTYRHVLLTIFCHAAVKETKFDDHNVIVHVQSGQLLTTYRHLADLCDEDEIDRRIVERALNKFESIGILKKEVANRKTLLTILCGVNFKTCQNPGQEMGQQTGQQKVVHINPKQEIRKIAGQQTGQQTGQSRDIKKDSLDNVYKGQSKTVVDIAFSKHDESDIRSSMKRFKLSESQIDSALWLIDNKVDSDVSTICWWVKNYDFQRIKDVFAHAKEKAKGSLGAYMQKLLKSQAYVPTDVTRENREFAIVYKEMHKWIGLEIGDKYVTFKKGNLNKELPLIYQSEAFTRDLMELHEASLSL